MFVIIFHRVIDNPSIFLTLQVFDNFQVSILTPPSCGNLINCEPLSINCSFCGVFLFLLCMCILIGLKFILQSIFMYYLQIYTCTYRINQRLGLVVGLNAFISSPQPSFLTNTDKSDCLIMVLRLIHTYDNCCKQLL